MILHALLSPFLRFYTSLNKLTRYFMRYSCRFLRYTSLNKLGWYFMPNWVASHDTIHHWNKLEWHHALLYSFLRYHTALNKLGWQFTFIGPLTTITYTTEQIGIMFHALLNRFLLSHTSLNKLGLYSMPYWTASNDIIHHSTYYQASAHDIYHWTY